MIALSRGEFAFPYIKRVKKVCGKGGGIHVSCSGLRKLDFYHQVKTSEVQKGPDCNLLHFANENNPFGILNLNKFVLLRKYLSLYLFCTAVMIQPSAFCV